MCGFQACTLAACRRSAASWRRAGAVPLHAGSHTARDAARTLAANTSHKRLPAFTKFHWLQTGHRPPPWPDSAAPQRRLSARAAPAKPPPDRAPPAFVLSARSSPAGHVHAGPGRSRDALPWRLALADPRAPPRPQAATERDAAGHAARPLDCGARRPSHSPAQRSTALARICAHLFNAAPCSRTLVQRSTMLALICSTQHHTAMALAASVRCAVPLHPLRCHAGRLHASPLRRFVQCCLPSCAWP